MAKSMQMVVTVGDQEYDFNPKTDVSCIIDLEEHIKSFPTEDEYVRVKNIAAAAEELTEELAILMFAPLVKPTAAQTEIDYNAEVQHPIWNDFDSKYMMFIQDADALNAGEYLAKIKLNNQSYRWVGNTKEVIEIPWRINKIAQEASLSKDEVTLDVHKLKDTIDVTHLGDGVISAVSSDENICQVIVEDNHVSIIGIDIGDTTVEITVSEGTNYLAQTLEVNVHVDILTELASTPPERIQMAAQAGIAASLWSVGDAAPITLTGVVDTVTVSGNYKSVLIGFDHNYGLEGSNKVHFSIMKNESDGDITFAGFRANSTSSNSGGYATSNLRTLMASFLSVIPENWKNAMVPIKKYTDNIGGVNNNISSITVTQDTLFILSAYEITGNNNIANEYEKSYQSQYDYYANGNSKVKYSHQDPHPVMNQWTRSVAKDSALGFCYVSTGGLLDAGECSATNLYGINPSFAIG